MAAQQPILDRNAEPKERLIASLFSQRDEDGTPLETYITHVKITEDGVDPTAVPPPGTSLRNPKMRFIIVAVKRNGKVRIHKSRANSNGTFSIGKTWNLEDLKSFKNHEGRGFTVSFQKSYYWAVESQKEKNMFVSGIVRIYTKYTNGKYPELIGFDFGVSPRKGLPPQPAQPMSGTPSHYRRPPIKASGSFSSSRGGSPGAHSSQKSPTASRRPSARSLNPMPLADPHPDLNPLQTGTPFLGTDDRRPSSKNRPVTPSNGSPDPNGSPALPFTSGSKPLARNGLPIPGEGNLSLPVKNTLSKPTTPDDKYPRSRSGSPRRLSRPRAMVDEQITPKERENSKSSNQSALLVGIPSRGISKPDEAGGPLETSRSVSPKPGQNFQSRIQPPTPRDVPISKSTPRDPSPGPSEKSQAAYIRDDKSFARHNQGSTNIPSHWTTDPIEKPRSTHPSSRSGGLFPGNPSARPTRSISPANVDPFSTGSVRPTPAPTPSPPNANAINCSTQLQQPPNAPSTASDGDGLFVGFSIRQDRPKGTSFGGTSNSNSDPKAYRFDDIGSTAPDTPLPLDSVPAPWMIKSGQTPVTSTFGSHDLESPSGVGVVSNNDGSHLHRDSVAPEEQLDSVQFGLPDDDCVPDPMFISRYSMKPKQFLPGSSNNALPSGGGTHSHSVLAESAELASQGTTISRTKSLLDQQKSKWAASTYEEESGDLLKEVEDVLEGFDWTSMGNADRLEENLRNELMALEAANVHAIVEGDDRMAGLIEKLGCAIVECDKMDSLLTLYAVELSSLSEDISHIEGQNRGVQVQTANQKGLKSELQGLLEAIAIPVGDIEALAGQQGSDDPDGIHESEKILVKFYKAIRIAEDSSEMNLASMRAVQERRDEYKAESTRFLNRMVNNLGMRFQAQFMNLAKRNTRNPDKGHPVIAPRDLLYTYLNRYTGLILYARMTHWDSYEKLKIKYIQPSQMLFSTDTKELVGAWKAAVRKATPEEAETFFTAAEEKDNAVVEKVSAVRSATIKRGRTFRGKNKKIESSDNIGSFCFKAALDHLVPLITPEQNFIVDFFHMSSRDTRSFIDFVEDHVVENYDANDLMIRRPVEPDSQNAKIVASIMERIFDTLPNELTGLVDHIVKQDQIQVVGILETIEIHLTEWAGTDQDFLLRMLNRLHDRLLGVFERFLVEQLRSIEDTKVSLKRRGVVSFIRIFPSFVSRIESQMIQPDVGDQILDIRETIDEAYQKINTTMFESLQAIAKANNSTNVDPEDKEQLYYHIMMMMNMHYYEVEIESHGNPSLQEFDQKARDLWAEHLGIYTRIVIRRPLGKLLDFLEGAEAFARSNPTVDVSTHITFSRSAFRKLMSNYDHKEVKKGIEALYKRVDKHFGDEEESLQGDMLPTVWKALRAEYISITDRRNRLLRSYYTDQEMDWNTTEIKNWFAKRAI